MKLYGDSPGLLYSLKDTILPDDDNLQKRILIMKKYVQRNKPPNLPTFFHDLSIRRVRHSLRTNTTAPENGEAGIEEDKDDDSQQDLLLHVKSIVDIKTLFQIMRRGNIRWSTKSKGTLKILPSIYTDTLHCIYTHILHKYYHLYIRSSYNLSAV